MKYRNTLKTGQICSGESVTLNQLLEGDFQHEEQPLHALYSLSYLFIYSKIYFISFIFEDVTHIQPIISESYLVALFHHY